MTNLEQEYNQRDILSKYALTKIGAIWEVLDANKGKKLFKKNGYKTKAFEALLEPLKLNEHSRPYTRGDKTYTMQSIGVKSGYSSLEVDFRCIIRTKGEHSNTYYDIKLHMGSFGYEGHSYDYTHLIQRKSLEEIEAGLESYTSHSLEDLELQLERLRQLEAQVKSVKDDMPYWSYQYV